MSCKNYVLTINALFLIIPLIHGGARVDVSHKEVEQRTCCTPENYRKYPYCNKRKKELLLRGDLLYLKGSLGGLEGAFGKTTINVADVDNKKQTTIDERDNHPDFDWRTGFRIGANLMVKCCDMGDDWTHFHGYADYKNYSQYGNWKLKYDAVDFIIGYDFYSCSRFLIKPFIGLRVANIRQDLKSNLETSKEDPTAVDIKTETITTDINDHEKFNGVGPEVGVEVDWYLGHNFSIYCMIDAVTYYGNIDGHYYHTDTLILSKLKNCVNKNGCFNGIGTDGVIGIRYDKYTKSNFHFMLKLGLEQHRIYNFSNLGSDGSLSMDGVIFEAGIGLRF